MRLEKLSNGVQQQKRWLCFELEGWLKATLLKVKFWIVHVKAVRHGVKLKSFAG